ncbi:carboxypeptidase-like regulatory domain-containing protein [Corallococcus interemptor]|uniref:carboxypeptidase-like regulatory domain-containing protein n=1 Tax=Corallococcus interemptor TaxID=2316720 RepID=UPI003D0274A2
MTALRRITVSTLFALGSGLTACSQATAEGPRAHVIQGTVVDTQGRPLSGAKIVLDVYTHNDSLNTDPVTATYDGTDKKALTDGSGRYSVSCGPGGWRVFGTVEREYNGDTFTLPLHPDNPRFVPGNEGGVRNFSWRLSGAIPGEQGGGFYGGTLKVVTTYESGFRDDQYPNLEVQLEPVGPLIDGSAGKPLSLKPGKDGAMRDVPIGRYKVQVRLGGKPVTLRIDDNTSAFQEVAVVDFKSKADASWSHCTRCAQLELRQAR